MKAVSEANLFSPGNSEPFEHHAFFIAMENNSRGFFLRIRPAHGIGSYFAPLISSFNGSYMHNVPDTKDFRYRLMLIGGMDSVDGDDPAHISALHLSLSRSSFLCRHDFFLFLC
jgi:hypothetical protein